jgi:hypothetical protein
MAVRADDIALGDLGQDPLSARAPDHAGDAISLLARITVIKVHRAWLVMLSTVCARDVAQTIQ